MNVIYFKLQEQTANKRQKDQNVLRPGFEPESSARKAGMLGLTTPSEHVKRAAKTCPSNCMP